MHYPSALTSAKFINRYKRFFVDARLENGDIVTAHCPNTGSMRHCIGEGWPVLLSHSDNPKRKLAYTLEFSQNPQGHWIGLNTGMANKLVEEALTQRKIPSLAGYNQVRREVKYAQNSRIDFLLSAEGMADCYVEVKSVTLLENGQGYFPDAVSTRGQKHLQDLMQMVDEGHRAVLLFLVQHEGIFNVSAAAHIDPVYADLLEQAKAHGVQVIALKARRDGEKYLADQVLNDSLGEKG